MSVNDDNRGRRAYVERARELLDLLPSDSQLKHRITPMVEDTIHRIGVTIHSDKEIPSPVLWLLGHEGLRDGRVRLRRFDRNAQSLLDHARVTGKSGMADRLLRRLVGPPAPDDFRRSTAAEIEIAVLGTLVSHWGSQVELWPSFPSHDGRPAESECLVHTLGALVNVEVTAAWTDQDGHVPAGRVLGRVYSKKSLVAEKLISKTRGKRRQLRRDCLNVLFLSRIIRWDERRVAFMAESVQNDMDRRLALELSHPRWHGFPLLIAELDADARLERVYSVRNRPRSELTQQRMFIEELEAAFREHWLVADAFEVRPIRPPRCCAMRPEPIRTTGATRRFNG